MKIMLLFVMEKGRCVSYTVLGKITLIILIGGGLPNHYALGISQEKEDSQ